MRNALRNALRNAMRLKGPVLVSVAVVVCGCGSDTTAPRAADVGQAFGALQLDQHAITLAVAPPHNTIQLHTTRFSIAGTVLPESGPVQYQVAHGDTSVTVSATGVVTAKVPSYGYYSGRGAAKYSDFVGPDALVIASVTVGGITRTDTAVVVVTETEPSAPLASLSIQPPAESLSVYRSGHWLTVGAIGRPVTLNLNQLDSQGNPVSNDLVYYRSSDLSVAYPYAGFVYGRAVSGLVANDTVTFFAQTWYYGVARSDSLQVRVGYPSSGSITAHERTLFASVTPELYWWPQNLELTAPARVKFQNTSNTQAIDVVFDDPGAMQTDTFEIRLLRDAFGYTFPVSAPGNIAPFFADTTGSDAACNANPYTQAADSTCEWTQPQVNPKRWRLISTPGTYTYHTLFGSGGRIIVH